MKVERLFANWSLFCEISEATEMKEHCIYTHTFINIHRNVYLKGYYLFVDIVVDIKSNERDEHNIRELNGTFSYFQTVSHQASRFLTL